MEEYYANGKSMLNSPYELRLQNVLQAAGKLS